MHPTLHIGSLSIPTHSVLLALAFVAAFLVKRSESRGRTPVGWGSCEQVWLAAKAMPRWITVAGPWEGF